MSVTGRHVQRLTHQVGADLARERDAAAVAHRRRQLPAAAAPPPVAVVEVDGGRLLTRQADAGPGVHQAEAKEDKVAFLLGVDTTPTDADPQPGVPPAFRDSRRVMRLVRQVRSSAAPAADDEAAAAEAAAAEAAGAAPGGRPAKPDGVARTCVASMCTSREFGPLVAAEAQARGFYQAARGAFVADGQAYNWQIHRAYFPHFEPIADLIHVLCYLFPAAWAVGPDEASRWAQFEAWMAACWGGRVADLIADLGRWADQLGKPPDDAPPDDPRQAVADAHRYLGNNQSRMDYPRYRRAGLPVTSSRVESLVGEFNARVKGRDKYWNRTAGAEAILQVRAAVLSGDDRLARYFAERPGCPYRRQAKAA